MSASTVDYAPITAHEHEWTVQNETTTHRGDTRVTLRCAHDCCDATKTEHY